MRIKGHVFAGLLRGRPLVEIFFDRIAYMIGFEPYKGTMDIELEKNIDIKMFATQTLEHVLMDGTKKVNAYLAPADIISQNEGKEQRYRCWAMQQVEGPYGPDVVELIAKDMLREKFSLAEGSEIEIEIFEIPYAEKKNFLGALRNIMPRRKSQLMRGR